MNVHHLELFHYVARHGGISRAVRHMPYGIQQPAVSGQLRQLEEELGTRLFERSPFRLTRAGEKLAAFIEPFFGRLAAVADEIRAGETPVLRLGAAEVALRDHVPDIAERLRTHLPGLRLSLRGGLQAELMQELESGEIDLAVAAVGLRAPAGLRYRRLLRVPLVLLVPARAPRRPAEAWWSPGPTRPPLISLPGTETLTRIFQRELRARGVRWQVTIEADSLLMIARYVACGQGVGVSLDFPGYAQVPGVRAVSLPGFAPIDVAAWWRDEPSPVVGAFLAEAVKRVRESWPRLAVDE